MISISKHRQFDDNGNWIEGKVIIARDSSLRKRMRAARRGKIPEELKFKIEGAITSAFVRRTKYANSYARSWGRY